MKNLYIFLFFAVLLLAFSTCCEDTPTIDSPHVFNDNPIVYSALEVGQKSSYVLLHGYKYYDNETLDSFNYLQDTLIVEIIDEDENGFLVKEYMTEGSTLSADMDYLWPDSTYQYYLKTENDSLHFYDINENYSIKSTLFWRWKNALDLNLYLEEIDISGWKTSLAYCECDQAGYDPTFELFDINYENLNITVRNSFMQVDGPGTTFIYSKDHGMVRSSQYSWWTQTGFGWDLLGVD